MSKTANKFSPEVRERAVRLSGFAKIASLLSAKVLLSRVYPELKS